MWNERAVTARTLLFVFALLGSVLPRLSAQDATSVGPSTKNIESPTAPAESSPGAPQVVTAPAAELSTRDSIVLGLVEGITEFLPISSTGHLVIANHALGLEANQPLIDASGQPLWYKKPSKKHPNGEPMTLKLAADTYIVIIQVGAIAAVVFLYFGQLLGILKGLVGQNAAGIRLLRNIVLAFIPAGVVGFLIHDWIDEHLFSIQAVIIALVSGAVLMFAAEKWRRDQGTKNSRIEPSDLTAKQALGIGVMQCLALWPGTSRSMVTMVGGYFTGLSPAKAAEFSFLVGLPTLAGAAVLKGFSAGPAMIAVFGWPHVLLGGVVATVSAAIAVKFLVHYLTRHGLGVFAIYRILLAVFLAVWFFA